MFPKYIRMYTSYSPCTDSETTGPINNNSTECVRLNYVQIPERSQEIITIIGKPK